MTVGFFAPLPPARTGVADYAVALLRRLRAHGTVEIAPARADINLYHLGNNHLHAAIYERALRVPGVVVLHDAVLHHFFLGAMTASQYTDEFIFNYGEWSRALAESLWRVRARSAADSRFFAYPMLRRVCETARAVIVHNPAAASMVLRHAPKARVAEIPMLLEPVESAPVAEIEAVRQRLEVDHRTVLAGIFGHLRESKRILPVLRAFRRLPAGSTVLLLAGSSGSRDLERAMEPFLTDSHVRRVPYTPAAEFQKLVQATDVCVNLRYPAAGETSAITISCMGNGKPVVVTSGDELSRLPESACIRVAPGIGEEAAVEAMMRWLIESPKDRREIGALAKDYIDSHHAPAQAASLYWQTLQSARS
jgi:glycosyltransferase involved in cell wall biosynthesis